MLQDKLADILHVLKSSEARLIAVSKRKSEAEIMSLYQLNQREFGENVVQELIIKQKHLPADIQWHMIGHLQRNKVKYIAPFISMIHSVDSLKLLTEINKQAEKNNRKIKCLFEIHIAQESEKHGFTPQDFLSFLDKVSPSEFPFIEFCGLMSIATFTDDREQIKTEFQTLQTLFLESKSKYFQGSLSFVELSMGMSDDFELALQYGSTMVRVGSRLFGSR